MGRKSLRGAHITCVECGEPLSAGLKRCSKCGSYQGLWGRKLQFIAAVATALSLIGGASLYVFKALPAVRKEMSWKTKIDVISFNSGYNLVALNAGDGPVILVNVALKIDSVGTRNIQINKRIEPGQMLQYDIPISSASRGSTVLLAHVTPGEWQTALAVARSQAEGACILATAFANNDSTYALYADASRRDPHHFPVLSTSAVLHYYDLRTGSGQIDIPAHTFLFRRSDCQPFPSELP